MKMKVPTDDAQKMMEEMEGGRMGYLFENMEKMDIQAERRKTEKAEKKLEDFKRKTQKELEQLKLDTENQVKQAYLDSQEKIKQATLDARSERNQIVLQLITLCRQEGLTKDETIDKLRDVYKLSDAAIDFARNNC
ncbi:MAG: hypothetical protein IJ468_15045 [Lachnospiraceae bacterium]|nr:hypothetical protein [Lachnospiraceae bacterium]